MALNIALRSFLLNKTRGFLGASSSSLIAPRIFGEQIYENFKDQALVNYLQNRGAARKGKRIERARLARINANKRRLTEANNPKQKKQLKRSVKLDKNLFRFLNERQLDSTLPDCPEDDVYFADKFRKKRYSFDEIIDFHKQAVHPDAFNCPDALVNATIELNLKMKIKKKKFIENISSTVCYPHYFQYQLKPRKIIALCKNPEDQEAAKQAGAITAGALDVATLLKSNQLTQRDFDHLVCHTDFIVDFSAVKGMKGQPYFPSKQRGNFGDNIVELVKFFKDGIDYNLKKTPDEPEFGYIECSFGKLNMTNDQLRENLIVLFNSINRFKPLNLADNKQFFQRVLITTPPTQETFVLKFWELIDDYVDPDTIVEEEEVEKERATS